MAKVDEIQNLDDFPDEEAASNRWDVDSDLLFFSSIDNTMKKWIETLQHMWSLCKLTFPIKPVFYHLILQSIN